MSLQELASTAWRISERAEQRATNKKPSKRSTDNIIIDMSYSAFDHVYFRAALKKIKRTGQRESLNVADGYLSHLKDANLIHRPAAGEIKLTKLGAKVLDYLETSEQNLTAAKQRGFSGTHLYKSLEGLPSAHNNTKIHLAACDFYDAATQKLTEDGTKALAFLTVVEHAKWVRAGKPEQAPTLFPIKP